MKWPDAATVRAEQCASNRVLYGSDDFPGGLPVISTGEPSTPETFSEDSGPDWDADDGDDSEVAPEWTG